MARRREGSAWLKLALGLVVLWFAVGPARTETAGPLPAMGATPNQHSASGISSGGYMAGQLQFALAHRLVGVGLIAAGPYGCADAPDVPFMPGPAGGEWQDLHRAVHGCMFARLLAFGIPNPQMLADQAKVRAKRGEIGAITDVLSDRIYIFTGAADRTVDARIVRAAAEFYRALGVAEA